VARQLGDRYYIGGRKDFGNIVASQVGSLRRWHGRIVDSLRLLRCRNNLSFHSTSHRSPWITSYSETGLPQRLTAQKIMPTKPTVDARA
jgi:hypothetical protein